MNIGKTLWFLITASVFVGLSIYFELDWETGLERFCIGWLMFESFLKV